MTGGKLFVVGAVMTMLALASSVGLGVMVLDGSAGDAVVDGDEDVADEAVDDAALVVTREEIEATATSLNDWWQEVDDDLEFTFTPLPLTSITDGADGATCDGDLIEELEEIDDNAFAARCDEGPVIAYDPAYVQTDAVIMKVTLAHEFAHHVQFQAGRLDPGRKGPEIGSELQADCWAGAWAAVFLVEDEYEGALDDVFASGDGVGARNSDDDAHGTPARRVAAYNHGFNNGPTSCAGDPFNVILP